MRSQVRRLLINITTTSVALAVAWQLWDTFAPTKIIRVDNVAVYIQHPPLSARAKIAWWNKNKDYLQHHYNLIKNPGDFSIVIMNFDGYESLPTGSNDGSVDDYHCFDDIKGKDRCIYNDIALMIHGNVSKKVFYGVDRKMYIETPDGKLTLREE
ncbi:DUF943 family protein [Cronobacter dublinensis]|uniref:DUF943 family protein n=1 Tax=Cronobacter dublinensis TaxID=413497 RepID=UPI00137552D6|nr:DUF943 family protein [Cronobacter dublinensis]NCH70033.1 DUF943 family protein [Cronobacter dublinensis]